MRDPKESPRLSHRCGLRVVSVRRQRGCLAHSLLISSYPSVVAMFAFWSKWVRCRSLLVVYLFSLNAGFWCVFKLPRSPLPPVVRSSTLSPLLSFVSYAVQSSVQGPAILSLALTPCMHTDSHVSASSPLKPTMYPTYSTPCLQ